MGIIKISYIAYAGAINPGLLGRQKVWRNLFPILWLLVANDVSEKFQPGFSSLAASPNTTPTLKKLVRFPNAEFNAELIGTNLKSQEQNQTACIPFSISHLRPI